MSSFFLLLIASRIRPSDEINSVYIRSAPCCLHTKRNGGSLTSSIGARRSGNSGSVMFPICGMLWVYRLQIYTDLQITNDANICTSVDLYKSVICTAVSVTFTPANLRKTALFLGRRQNTTTSATDGDDGAGYAALAAVRFVFRVPGTFQRAFEIKKFSVAR